MQTEKVADLHIHTFFSDGDSGPEEAVRLARECGLAAISVCDHDELRGSQLALEAAGEGIEVISGVEMSTTHNGIEVHLLGYLIDTWNESLEKRLSVVRKERVERVYRICQKLRTMGVPADPEEILASAGLGSVGRMHVAEWLWMQGHAGSIREAFQRYLGQGRPGYVPSPRVTTEEGVALVRAAGGVAVYAHPGTTARNDIIPELANLGVQGIEAYYPAHVPEETKEFLELAARYSLCVTGGSDWHGRRREEVTLGGLAIPYGLVEELKARQLRDSRPDDAGNRGRET